MLRAFASVMVLALAPTRLSALSNSPSTVGAPAVRAATPAARHTLGRGVEKLSLAPMMEYTDQHMRFFLRLISRKTVMWSEMVTADKLIHNAATIERSLAFSEQEHPVVLQIGASHPEKARKACEIARPYNYDAINLNCGCPSDKVAGKGCFGASLMLDPSLVADICLQMREGSGGDVPITVKCRIGVDDQDSYEQLVAFVKEVSERAGVSHFIVHARKAILGGLSPAQNRSIPPLKYDYVYQLVRDFPDLDFTLNGGITTYREVEEALKGGAHGAMVGRAMASKPWYWSQVDSRVYGETDPGLSRREVLSLYGVYGEEQEAKEGEEWLRVRRRLLKPVWNLFAGEKHGKKFRVKLEAMQKRDISFGSLLEVACGELLPEQLDSLPGEGPIFAIEEEAAQAAATRAIRSQGTCGG